MKSTDKKKSFIVFCAVCALILVLFVTADVLAVHFSNIISIALGGDRPYQVDSDSAITYFKTETKSKNEANALAEDITKEVSEEGFILLKNKNSALPVESGTKVSVFGKNSVNLVYGGSGSGGGDQTFKKKDLYEGLAASGLNFNPALKSFYEDNSLSGKPRSGNPSDLNSGETVSIATGETPISAYSAQLKNTYKNYSDCALIVISRVGGEGFDLPMGEAAGAKHYLALDKNEKDLVEHVKSSGFKKVVVVLNTLNIVEADFVEKDGIDACIWIGGPGSTGTYALGEILVGKITPSARTTDTWAKDFTLDPTWHNFSDRNVKNGDAYFNTDTGKDVLNYFVNYEENVYVGYRYYETRDEEEKKKGNRDWYKENVIYPFGYGLSYTTFDTAFVSEADRKIDGKEKIKVKVTVKNTGSYKGKNVIELYACLPYTVGGVEKPFKVLCGFIKTPMLYPESANAVVKEDAANEKDKKSSCEAEIEIDPYSFASYDYKGVSGFTGYILEKGAYKIQLAENAHEEVDSFTLTLDNNVKFENDPVTGEKVENRFTDCENKLFNSDLRLDFLMSRNDLSVLPDAPKASDKNADSAFLNAYKDVSHNNPLALKAEMPKTGETPVELASALKYDGGSETIFVDYFDEAWEKILNSLSVADMASLFNNGAFQTVYLERINKPKTLESDGPVGWCNFISVTDETWKGNNAYTSQVVMSATWNVELIERMGEIVGEEGLWGSKRNKGEEGLSYSGWYAPGVNIHRSPFGGRNFEYFSEDPFLTGKLGAAEVRGCSKKGVYCYVKHFALNEQETHRGGGSSWVTEQAMREIYLKPFEMIVKEASATAIMSSFNRIGTRWTGGDYRLLTEILRDEWGFKGTVISDYNENSAYMNSKQMIYAGGDLNLCSNKAKMWNDYDVNSAADVYVLRNAAKNVLYTTLSSNMVNGFNYKYAMAIWKIVLIVVNVVAFIGVCAWGFFTLRKTLKKQ